MHSLIITVTSRTKLFKQPYRIYEVLECNGKDYLIIGIQRFKVYHSAITVWYTCQDLTQTDYVSKYKPDHAAMVEAEVKLRHDYDHFDKIELGTIYFIEGQHYQIAEYTEIKIVGTDLLISFYVKPIFPIDRKEAKAKHLQVRKKKLSLEIV